MKTCVLPLFAAAFLLSACGNSYNTKLPAPTGEEKYSDIIPAEIGGVANKGSQLDLDPNLYHGAQFDYEDKASITMVQCGSVDALDKYFKETVVPQMDNGYSSKVSGKFNGVWSARAKGNSGRFHAWQNNSYVFVIRAGSDELFAEVVEKFSFISKK